MADEALTEVAGREDLKCARSEHGSTASTAALAAVPTAAVAVTSTQRRNQAALDAAWSQPAHKTPHSGFKTVAETEAAGYVWHDSKWMNLKAFEDLEVHQKQYEALTEEELASKSAVELRALHLALMADFEELGCDTGVYLPSPELQSGEDRPALTKDILSMANLLRTTVKGARRGDFGMPRVVLCASCGAPPPPRKKLLLCARCETVGYCGTSCQREHWKVHQPACKRFAANRAEAVADGIDISKKAQVEVEAWFRGVPHLFGDVAALAWQQRSEEPFLIVEGGPNPRLAKIRMVTRKEWELAGLQEIWAHRFDSPTFDMQKHFFVMIHRDQSRHDLPVLTPRLLFPHAPEYMDAFAQEQTLRRDRERAEAKLPPQPMPPVPPATQAAAAPEAPLEKLETCWACRQSLPRFRFSGHQWRKGGPKRRCSECVAAGKAIVVDSVVSLTPGKADAASTPHNNFDVAIDSKGVHVARRDTGVGPTTSKQGVRKTMGYDWNCDSCNAPSRKGTECVWWTNHRVLGDIALCLPCAAAGKTPDSIAQNSGCAQQ